MGNFNLDDYEPVHKRIPKFYEIHHDGRIITELVSSLADTVIFKATLFKDAAELEKNLPLSTGYATETAGDGYVNKTSHLENCETSAIGRALANIGLAGDKRPSREEMKKTKPEQKSPTQKEIYDIKPHEKAIDEAKDIKTLKAIRAALGAESKKMSKDQVDELVNRLSIRTTELIDTTEAG